MFLEEYRNSSSNKSIGPNVLQTLLQFLKTSFIFLTIQFELFVKFYSNFMPIIQFSTQYFISIESEILCADTVFSTKLHSGTNRAARNFCYPITTSRIKGLSSQNVKYSIEKGNKIYRILYFNEENMARKNNFNMDVVVRDAIDYIVESKTVCNVNISKQTFRITVLDLI